MLLGEAPGQFEDVLGIPFVGPAGRILTQIIKYVEYPFQYVITNMVCCRPQTVVWLDSSNEEEDINDYEEGTDYEIHDLNRDPEKSEMDACRPHIDEIFDEFNPDGIVYLGKVATNYSAPRVPTVEVKHPAYIARLEYKLLTVRKEARKISKFIEKLDAL